MKAARSLSLILAFVTSALPVTAQEQTEGPQAFDRRNPAPGTGPLARAAAHEAVRLAAGKSPSFGTVPQGGTPAASDWSRVRQLTAGTEIIVTVRNARPVPRFFMSADDSELVVSNGGVERIARIDVAEVRMLKKRDFFGVANSAFFKWGTVIGLAAGLTTAGIILHSNCKPETCDTAVVIGGYTALGFLIGGGIGALMAVGSKTETVIYRAP